MFKYILVLILMSLSIQSYAGDRQILNTFSMCVHSSAAIANGLAHLEYNNLPAPTNSQVKAKQNRIDHLIDNQAEGYSNSTLWKTWKPRIKQEAHSDATRAVAFSGAINVELKRQGISNSQAAVKGSLFSSGLAYCLVKNHLDNHFRGQNEDAGEQLSTIYLYALIGNIAGRVSGHQIVLGSQRPYLFRMYIENNLVHQSSKAPPYAESLGFNSRSALDNHINIGFDAALNLVNNIEKYKQTGSQKYLNSNQLSYEALTRSTNSGVKNHFFFMPIITWLLDIEPSPPDFNVKDSAKTWMYIETYNP